MGDTKINREQFYEFLTENQQKFYRVAISYVKEQDAALDVVQEAVVNALRSLEKLRQPEYMKTWFYRIIIHTAINYLKKNQRYVADEETLALAVQEEKGLNKEESLDLYAAVEKLNEKYRSVIVLRYFEDLKLHEIADILNIPENTVKTRVRTALAGLSRFIKEEDNYEY